MNKHLVLAIVWITYLAAHSFFASEWIKLIIQEKLSVAASVYRLLYSVLSTIGLFFILALMAIIPPSYFIEANKVMRYAGMVLAIWGIILITASFRKISGKVFLGLKKSDNSSLVTDGIHGRIRHPIYSGTILVLLGMFLYTPSDVVLLSIGLIFSYLPIGIFLEEKKLIKEFGQEYIDYKKEVPALIPKIL